MAKLILQNETDPEIMIILEDWDGAEMEDWRGLCTECGVWVGGPDDTLPMRDAIEEASIHIDVHGVLK